MLLDSMKLVGISILIVLGIGGVSGEGFFPDPLKRCPFGDEECYVTQAQNYLRNFKNGIPERNVPAIEPANIGTVSVHIGEPGGSMHFNLVMTNTTMHNFANTMVVKSFKIRRSSNDSTGAMKTSVIMSNPELEVRANHELNGKMLILPIASKGKMHIKLRNALIKTTINYKPEKRPDGHTYLRITEYRTEEKMDGGSFTMTNLFKDNEELSKSTMKILNDEWDALSTDVRPKIMQACDRTFRATLQILLDTIPYDEFFESQ